MTERALVFTSEKEATVKQTEVSTPGEGEVVVDAELSAISSGTEMLIYRGDAPTDIEADSSLETIDGDLSYPLQYGYSLVGTVTEIGSGVSETWLHRDVIAFHPHQTRFTSSIEYLTALPTGVSPRAGTIFPSAETATNFLLDGEPKIGERVVVFGAGVIGLCTVQLLSEFPLESLVVVEPRSSRQELAISFGADEAISPKNIGERFSTDDAAHLSVDLVYELSGQPDALNDAIEVVGFDGRVVVGSWYGSKQSHLDLGGSFHRDRIDITSSQVSSIDPSLRGRWSKGRRAQTALRNLQAVDCDTLISDVVPFKNAGDAYERIDDPTEDTLQVLLSYE